MLVEFAKIVTNGDEQSIRLPKEFHVDGDEFVIQHPGKTILPVPKEEAWNIFMEGLNGFSEDFLPNGREPQGTLDEREAL